MLELCASPYDYHEQKQGNVGQAAVGHYEPYNQVSRTNLDQVGPTTWQGSLTVVGHWDLLWVIRSHHISRAL